jgi:hypothetical protein
MALGSTGSLNLLVCNGSEDKTSVFNMTEGHKVKIFLDRQLPERRFSPGGGGEVFLTSDAPKNFLLLFCKRCGLFSVYISEQLEA